MWFWGKKFFVSKILKKKEEGKNFFEDGLEEIFKRKDEMKREQKGRMKKGDGKETSREKGRK